MLKIHIPKTEFYDESKNTFVYVNECELELEHSLHSVYLWEQHYNKPFLNAKKEKRSRAESVYYVKCMTLNGDIPLSTYSALTSDLLEKIDEYVNAPMTGTKITEHEQEGKAKKNKTLTAEEIYHMMIALNIPFECQYWHLNSLMTLIRVCDIRSRPPKKYSRSENAARYAKMNAARRRKH